MERSEGPGRRALLKAAAIALAPPAVELSPDAWAEFFGIVEQALRQRSVAIRVQFEAFLIFIRLASWLRCGGSFAGLSGTRREALLRWLEDNPVRSLRQGFWGLKTVVMMGFYGRPAVWRKLAYTPVPDGNRMLHG